MRYTDYKFHVPEEKIVRLIVDTRECGNDSSPLWKKAWGRYGALLQGPRKSSLRSGETWVVGDSPVVGLLLYEHRFDFERVYPARNIGQLVRGILWLPGEWKLIHLQQKEGNVCRRLSYRETGWSRGALRLAAACLWSAIRINWLSWKNKKEKMPGDRFLAHCNLPEVCV